MIAVERASWSRRPSTARAFAGIPPPLRFVFGPVLTFAMSPPSPDNEKALVRADEGQREASFARVLASAGSASRRIQALSGTGFFGYEAVVSVGLEATPLRS